MARATTLKSQIQANTRRIVELHQRVHETAHSRDLSAAHRESWSQACLEFRTQYDALAFIGGVSTARDRIRSGDAQAIEYALCFIEVRPYFFRSGYMFKDFLRVLRNVELSPAQQARYDRVCDAYQQYRQRKQGRA